jgi:hypothetical protein
MGTEGLVLLVATELEEVMASTGVLEEAPVLRLMLDGAE